MIWFKDNYPEFCFEIGDDTSITKKLLKLYKIRHLDMVPVIVDPESICLKFEEITNNFLN